MSTPTCTKKKVLLLSAVGSQGIAFIKALHKKYDVYGVFDGKLNYGYYSRYLKGRYIVSSIKDIEVYYQDLLKILAKDKFDVIIPLYDEDAYILSKYMDELLKYAKFIMPTIDVFDAGYDKYALMSLCKRNGYPHPETVMPETGLKGLDLDKLPYPLLIKPNITSGARGMTLVNNVAELQKFYPHIVEQYGECHLQHYIHKGGAQVEVQVYINEKQELVQSSVIYKYRWYPENGGSSCCAKSVKNDKIVNICYNILKDLGWIGFADFDTIEDPTTGELMILEINPRVPACIKVALASGLNWAEVIAGEYLKEAYEAHEYKTGKFLRHFGFECLWFYYSKSRWKTKPNWFKLIGKDIYYQDVSGWSDPLPFIMGSLGNLVKQLNSNFRKEKGGLREQ